MSDNPEKPPINNITPDSILDRIAKDRLNVAHYEALAEEEMADYKDAVNRLFSSPDGQFFLNKILRFSGLTTFDKTLNPANLVEMRGRQSIWFLLIRPFLDKSIRSELDF